MTEGQNKLLAENRIVLTQRGASILPLRDTSEEEGFAAISPSGTEGWVIRAGKEGELRTSIWQSHAGEWLPATPRWREVVDEKALDAWARDHVGSRPPCGQGTSEIDGDALFG